MYHVNAYQTFSNAERSRASKIHRRQSPTVLLLDLGDHDKDRSLKIVMLASCFISYLEKETNARHHPMHVWRTREVVVIVSD
jgi:hypothetical protein